MKQAITIGLDIAKDAFQAHGADATGHVLFRKRITRTKLIGFLATQAPCIVAMEACAGAHYWAREIGKLGIGAIDRAGLRQAVRQAAEERRGGCRSDLRSGAAAEHALRSG